MPMSLSSQVAPNVSNFAWVHLTILVMSGRESAHAETDLIATASRRVSMYLDWLLSMCLHKEIS